jgi:hypothetical protein
MRDRSEPRIRTKLRSGRLSNLDGVFITECLVLDRSPHGAKLKLPKTLDVPKEILFRDDAVATAIYAKICWRRGDEIGIHLPKGHLDICRPYQPVAYRRV